MGRQDGGASAEPSDLSGVGNEHGCFGCGRLNPHGLRLRFDRDGDGVRAPFTPRPVDEGYDGVVHGGIVATLLDEAMAWSCYAQDAWVVTATIEVRFRRPVAVGVPLRALGRVVRDRGRLLDAAGELRRAADDLLLAEATATFARVPEEQARAWRARYLASSDETGP
jgi:uncharacterized protein (TIGR00369 family)